MTAKKCKVNSRFNKSKYQKLMEGTFERYIHIASDLSSLREEIEELKKARFTDEYVKLIDELKVFQANTIKDIRNLKAERRRADYTILELEETVERLLIEKVDALLFRVENLEKVK